MQGKLFPESSSIYQDEAKILFDYFSKAANRILEEEKKVQGEISEAKAQLMFAKKGKRSATIKKSVFFSLFLLLGAGMFYYIYIYIGSPINFEKPDTYFYIIPLAVAFILFLSLLLGGKKHKRNVILQQSILAEREKQFQDIRRDYKVGKIGVAYVPIAKKIPFDDKTITVDLSNTVGQESFNLTTLNNPNRLEESTAELKRAFAEMPKVEKSEGGKVLDTSEYSLSMQDIQINDFTSKITDNINNLSQNLQDVSRTSVVLPVISPESENMKFLEECGTTTPKDYPIVEVFDDSSLEPRIRVFEELYKQRRNNENTGNESALEDLMLFIGKSNQMYTTGKINCLTSILAYNDNIFSNVLKTSYRNFSPKLEAEVLENIKTMNFNFGDMADTYKPFKLKESSLMKFDLYSNSWVDEVGNRNALPYSISQIQEEIFMPLVDNLMEENKIERRKLYDKIQTQKLDYLNKWHTETQDFYGRNRDTSDKLKSEIIQALSKYNAAYSSWKAMKDTITRMEEQQNLSSGKVVQDDSSDAAIIAQASSINQSFENLQAEFEAYMERIQDDIEAKAENFGHVTFFEAFLYAEEAYKIAIASDSIKDMDPRQLKLAKLSPYIAKYGNLPPSPMVEEDVYSIARLDLEQEAREKVSEIRTQNIENTSSLEDSFAEDETEIDDTVDEHFDEENASSYEPGTEEDDSCYESDMDDEVSEEETDISCESFDDEASDDSLYGKKDE